MDTDKLRFDLFHKILQANEMQLKELNKMVTDYLVAENGEDDWDSLPERYKQQITESLRQADAGLGKPINEVIESMRAKYGWY